MNEHELFKCIGEIGRLLLRHSAEIYRVEESLKRMCKSYGFKDIGVFALPSYFTLGATLHDGSSPSIIIRTIQNRTNLDCVYELNNLVRYICQYQPDETYIKKEIKRIKNLPEKMNLVFLGYGIGAGFFAVFFGGGLSEFVAATIIGFITYFVIWLHEILEINALVRTMVTSMVLSACAIISYHFHLIHLLQPTIIGCLMVLVPGMAITNSLRDIMSGDYISGQARMLEAFLTATAIALGVGSMLVLLKGLI